MLAASWGWAAARPGEQSRAHSGQHQEAEAGSPELRVRPAELICAYPEEVCKEGGFCLNCLHPAGHMACLSLREMHQLQG